MRSVSWAVSSYLSGTQVFTAGDVVLVAEQGSPEANRKAGRAAIRKLRYLERLERSPAAKRSPKR